MVKVSTNGGFTAVAYVAFTGSAGSYERIFELGDSTQQISIAMSRSDVSQNMNAQLKGVSGYMIVSTNSPIIQNEWAVYAIRYRVSDSTLEIFKNGVSIVSSTVSSIPDFTANYGYIGKSSWSSDAYFNGNIGGLYLYDRCLSNGEMSFVSYQLTLKGIPLTANFNLFFD